MFGECLIEVCNKGWEGGMGLENDNFGLGFGVWVQLHILVLFFSSAVFEENVEILS